MKPGSLYTIEQYIVKDNTIINGQIGVGRTYKGGGITLNYEDGSTRNGKEITIIGNHINNTLYGITLYSVDNTIVSNNIVDLVNYGISLIYDPIWSWSTEKFKECTVSGNVVTSVSVYG